MEFLLGNPFSTPVGQCLGKAALAADVLGGRLTRLDHGPLPLLWHLTGGPSILVVESLPGRGASSRAGWISSRNRCHLTGGPGIPVVGPLPGAGAISRVGRLPLSSSFCLAPVPPCQWAGPYLGAGVTSWAEQASVLLVGPPLGTGATSPGHLPGGL